jgi:hypothetical protein
MDDGLDRINEGLESDKLLILVATIVDESWDKLFSNYSVSLQGRRRRACQCRVKC